MKVAVYTIALNEIQHVQRWVDSVRDADYLVVADTGSTDGTAQALAAAGVSVYNLSIKPWRFDDARNAALALVPSDADVCISMDMDEFMAPGWRTVLERDWTQTTTRINYVYQFDALAGQSFYADKIHARHGYRWRRPVHETVFSTLDSEVIVTSPSLVMNQIQDTTKSRKSYLPLLLLSHQENPTDSQTLFWYARELMYNDQTHAAIEKFEQYLNLNSSTWPVERSEAMRYLGKLDSRKLGHWLLKAIEEADYRRETWCDLAEFYYHKQEWANCYWASYNGIKLGIRTGTYLDDPAVWGSKIYDIGSIACHWLGMKQQALSWIEQAISIDPADTRLQNNREFFLKGNA